MGSTMTTSYPERTMKHIIKLLLDKKQYFTVLHDVCYGTVVKLLQLHGLCLAGPMAWPHLAITL
jgi:hypothetical protein